MQRERGHGGPVPLGADRRQVRPRGELAALRVHEVRRAGPERAREAQQQRAARGLAAPREPRPEARVARAQVETQRGERVAGVAELALRRARLAGEAPRVRPRLRLRQVGRRARHVVERADEAGPAAVRAGAARARAQARARAARCVGVDDRRDELHAHAAPRDGRGAEPPRQRPPPRRVRVGDLGARRQLEVGPARAVAAREADAGARQRRAAPARPDARGYFVEVPGAIPRADGLAPRRARGIPRRAPAGAGAAGLGGTPFLWRCAAAGLRVPRIASRGQPMRSARLNH